MNERLSLQDLIDLLAKKQEIAKKDAETFLREFVAVIAENIEAGEPVRIKDFGTFRLVMVNARKSVDVNTGEAIEIAAHHKLSFNPDKSLRETVNRPFAHFESVALEEGVTFGNVQSEVITEGAGEDATVEENITGYIATEPAPEAEYVSGPVQGGQIPVPGHIVSGTDAAAPDNTDKEDTVPAIYEDDGEDMQEKPEKKDIRKRYIWLAFPVFLIIAGFATGALYFQEIAGYLAEGPSGKKTETVKPGVKPEDNQAAFTDTVAQKADTAGLQVPAPGQGLQNAASAASLGIETIQPGHTLRNIALKYYGNKSFWVYIYEENKDKIKNANNVPLGTKLTIPSPAKYDINPKDAESVSKARKMEEELFRQMNL
jgi:nucleoid DNA-binding protein/nucleoid-associated protein YgaU